ncbi:MAG: hypothetical protein R6V77_04070 [Candidatus Cloacimonadaceae bacterium]
MENQAVQLHEKVQALIEQYSKDKKRLAELEAALKEKSTNSSGYEEQIKKLQSDVKTEQAVSEKLKSEIIELKKKNQELEKAVGSFESFAGDLNSKIDSLIPKIEKL